MSTSELQDAQKFDNIYSYNNFSRSENVSDDSHRSNRSNLGLVAFTHINCPDDLLLLSTKQTNHNYSFHLILEGSLDYTIENTKITANSDSGIIQLSANKIKTETKSIRAVLVDFNKTAVEKAISDRLGSYNLLMPEIIKIEYSTSKAILLRSLCFLTLQQLVIQDTHLIHSKTGRYLEKALLNAFIDCIDRRIVERSKKLENQVAWFADLETWIDNHLSKPIKLQDLADIVGISRRALQKAIRIKMNCTPMEIVYLRRLTKARSLLQSPDRNTTVLHVALEVGYSHPSRFASQYQKQFKEKPSATLKKAREQ